LGICGQQYPVRSELRSGSFDILSCPSYFVIPSEARDLLLRRKMQIPGSSSPAAKGTGRSCPPIIFDASTIFMGPVPTSALYPDFSDIARKTYLILSIVVRSCTGMVITVSKIGVSWYFLRLCRQPKSVWNFLSSARTGPDCHCCRTQQRECAKHAPHRQIPRVAGGARPGRILWSLPVSNFTSGCPT
jgi:hypothetical protein